MKVKNFKFMMGDDNMNIIRTRKSFGLYEMLALLCIFTLIFSNQLRVGILGEKLGLVNYISTIILVSISIKYFNKFNLGYMLYIYIYICYFIINYIYCQFGVKNFIFTFCSFITPLMLIGLEIDELMFKKFFYLFLKIFNVIIFIITLIGILDIFLGNKIILGISEIMSNSLRNLIITQQTLNISRMYSFMGHPLFNTQLYLMFFILNLVYELTFGKLLVNKIILYLIPIIGISMTASKTGLLLLVISMVCFNNINNAKKKIFHYIIIVLSIFLIFNIGIFDNTIERLLSESLTTGRAEYWEIYKQSNLYPIRLFSGYGNQFVFYYSQIVPWISAGFEYPIRLFAFEQGVIFAILIYIGIFIYPLILFIKRKQIKLFFMYLIIFIDVNTYNTIALLGDYMLVFSIFLFIILNSSRVIYLNKNYD